MQFEFSAGAFVYRIVSGKAYVLFLDHGNVVYDVPKGHIEKGESVEQAARREIYEEAGIKGEFLPYFREQSKYIFSIKGKRVLKTVYFFLMKVSSDKVKVSGEHTGYRWLSHEEAIRQVKFKDLRALLQRVFDYIGRYETISKLNSQYASLANGRNWKLSKNFVPGEGPLNAKIMLLGQAPGQNEDMQLRPFIGRSGKLLTSLMEKTKIKRQRCYITSVVQFFPPANRVPDKVEIGSCKPFLEKQIEIIKPKYMILLGSVAINSRLGKLNPTQMHGKSIVKGGITYLVTFHPAAALRFEKNYKLMEEDFKAFAQITKK